MEAGPQTGEDTITGASGKGESAENHATGPPFRRGSRRQKSKLCTLSIEKDVYDRWCRVGTAEGLKTDTDIACYFVKQYEGAQVGAQSYARCVHCHAPLILVCTKCRQPSQGGQLLCGEQAMVCDMDTNISQKHTVADDNQLDEAGGCFTEDAGSHNSDQYHRYKPDCSFQSLPIAGDFVNDEGEHSMNDNHHLLREREESGAFELPSNSTKTENFPGNIFVSTSVDAQAVNSSIKLGSCGEGSVEVGPQTKTFTCTICQKAFRNAHGLKQHQNVHTKERPYKCHICQASFKWSGNLKVHMDIHEGDKHHECQICGQHFKWAGGVRRHMKKHKDQVHVHGHLHSKSPAPSEMLTRLGAHTNKKGLVVIFSCSVCNQTFDCEDEFMKHTKKHKVKGEIIYEECQKVFSKPQSLQKHLEKVHRRTGEKPYKCQNCSLAFASHVRLTNHIRTHTGERPYMCSVCGSAFTLYSTLRVHRRTHTGEKPYQCQQCDEKFKWKNSLSCHMFKHTKDKTYTSLCHLCGAWFRTAEHLTSHLSRHVDTRDFKCHTCHKDFKTKGDLYSHTRYVHSQKAKSFKCPDCDMAFVTKSMLKKHSRKHTGERPYKCEHCSKTFSYHNSLSSHRRLHEGKKQHTCEVCGAAFVNQKNLTSHTRKHTGEKPYQCKLCSQAFSWHSGLKNHMRKH